MGIVQSIITSSVDSIPEISNTQQINVVIVDEEEEEKKEDTTMIPVKSDEIQKAEVTEPTCPDDWVSMDIGYGFESKHEVHDMYMTVKKLGLEEWIKTTDWCNMRYSDESKLISKNLKNNNHSGASYGGCLWKTKEVYKNGWYPKYCKNA